MLVGGIPTPLKNMSQLGLFFRTEWKNKVHVPNHQPEWIIIGINDGIKCYCEYHWGC